RSMLSRVSSRGAISPSSRTGTDAQNRYVRSPPMRHSCPPPADRRGVATSVDAPTPAGELLPELAGVRWRRRADTDSLRRAERHWPLHTAAYSTPVVAAAAFLIVLNPIVTPIALVLLAHAWIVPELHAARGAKVLRSLAPGAAASERTARGLLLDLVAHQE